MRSALGLATVTYSSRGSFGTSLHPPHFLLTSFVHFVHRLYSRLFPVIITPFSLPRTQLTFSLMTDGVRIRQATV